MDFEAIKSFFTSLTLEKLAPALVTFLVGYFVLRILIKFFDRVLARSKITKTVHTFLRSTVKIALYSILALIIASALGIDVTSLVAVFSVVSLAISLAVQGLLSNVAGGIMILSAHPFEVGDWIEIGTIGGAVKEIGISYTTLLTGDSKEIFVPNSEISNSKITNFTKNGHRRVDMTFNASYKNDIEEVKVALLKAAMLPMVQMDPEPFVAVNKYGEHSIEYVLRVWTSASNYWSAYFEITERVKTCFDEAGIEMNYPHINVHTDVS